MKAGYLKMTFVAIVSTAVNVPALAEPEIHAHTDWQTKRLFEPTGHQLQRESNGQVFIYHNMPETTVDRALDTHFDRVQSMMFTGVVVTDTQGRPLVDTETGEVVTYDDGCD